MQVTISKENYLKAIAEAESEGHVVIAATLTRWLNITPAAVTTATRRLKRDGLVEVSGDGRLQLTGQGREVAARVLHRHYLIERMLTEMFGMEWYKVHEEAERLEHAVSEEFERRLAEKLGTGKPCPHGSAVNADSATDRRLRGWLLLDELQTNGPATVTSVYERDRKLLEYFDGVGIRPGCRVTVVARNYDDTLTLQLADKSIQLGRAAALKVWVRRDGIVNETPQHL